MAVEGNEGFPHRGRLDFINNQVNPSTGTIAIRGLFKSSHKKSVSALIPGMFVRVRLPLGDPHKAKLIIDRVVSAVSGKNGNPAEIWGLLGLELGLADWELEYLAHRVYPS